MAPGGRRSALLYINERGFGDRQWKLRGAVRTPTRLFLTHLRTYSEEIIKDIDSTQHALTLRGTIVPDLDNCSGHRKDTSRTYTWGKLAGFCDEDAAALEEQLNLGRGISGSLSRVVVVVCRRA